MKSPWWIYPIARQNHNASEQGHEQQGDQVKTGSLGDESEKVRWLKKRWDFMVIFLGTYLIGSLPKDMSKKQNYGMWYIISWYRWTYIYIHTDCWFQTWFLFSISFMGCHPSHWRTPSFFKMVIAPPTRYVSDTIDVSYVAIYIADNTEWFQVWLNFCQASNWDEDPQAMDSSWDRFNVFNLCLHGSYTSCMYIYMLYYIYTYST